MERNGQRHQNKLAWNGLKMGVFTPQTLQFVLFTLTKVSICYTNNSCMPFEQSRRLCMWKGWSDEREKLKKKLKPNHKSVVFARMSVNVIIVSLRQMFNLFILAGRRKTLYFCNAKVFMWFIECNQMWSFDGIAANVSFFYYVCLCTFTIVKKLISWASVRIISNVSYVRHVIVSNISYYHCLTNSKYMYILTEINIRWRVNTENEYRKKRVLPGNSDISIWNPIYIYGLDLIFTGDVWIIKYIFPVTPLPSNRLFEIYKGFHIKMSKFSGNTFFLSSFSVWVTINLRISLWNENYRHFEYLSQQYSKQSTLKIS